MPTPLALLDASRHCFISIAIVLLDFGRLLTIAVRSRRALAAENLFLRKQLALFQERKVKPRRAHDSTRWVMATLSRMFECGMPCRMSNPIRSSGGIAKDSGCFGAGNPSRREDRGCRRTCDS
jgi:hypothetical protein